ncbi:hypothetical protein [Fundicoccus culcitae]|uniref:ABC transporter permease n=1 Tax=Fundicoccus culcitae TaxID=2969821 RepID=A0ABY5P4S3_9LACT|nr:hypothetical protein [Fundicoccus culcitae]UUX33610.1 hypothetical protein NRE15_11990 [Fundicoccus culcitae]
MISINSFQLFKADFKRFVLNYKIVLAIVGVIATLGVSANEYIMSGINATYLVERSIFSLFPTQLILIVASFPVVSSFVEDWEFRYLYNIAMRSGTKEYSIIRLFFAFITSFGITFIGCMIFFGIAFIYYPLLNEGHPIEYQVYPPYSELAYTSFPASYTIARIIIYSLSAGFWTIVGLFVSTLIPNKFVAYVSPFIVNYFVSFSSFLLPRMLQEDVVSRSRVVFPDSGFWPHFVYFIVYYIILILIVGWEFYRMVIRRLSNELL